MVGKNNKFLKENKNNQRFLRFSLRKLSVGVVSVAIAAGFYVGGSQSVLADTPSTVPVVNQSTSNDNLAENTDKNTVNLQSSSASADSSAVASAADSTAAEAVKSAAPAASSAAEQQKTATLNVTEVKPAAALNTANLLDNKAQSNAALDTSAKPSDDDLLKNIKTYDPDNATFNKYQTLVNTYKNETTDTSSQYVFSVINDDRIDTDFIWTIDRNTGSKVSVYLADSSWYKQEEITSYHHFASEGGNFNVTSIFGKDVILNYTPKNSSASIDVVDPNGPYLKIIYELSGTDDNFYSSITDIVPAKSQPVIKFLYKDPSTGKLLDLREPIYDLNGLTGKRFVLDTSSKAYDYYKSKDKEAFDGFDFVGVIGNQQGTFTQFSQGKTYVKHYADNDLEVTYHQIDAEGTMHISYSSNGRQYTPVITKDGKVSFFTDGEKHFIHGEQYYTEDGSLYLIDKDGKQHLIEDNKHALEAYSLKAGHSLRASDTLMIFNPFVAGDYAYEFIYVPHSDLNQTITRTIKVHEPGKDANTITQTAKIFRDATVDDVTGEVTYTAWSTDATDWAEYDAPVHAGYTVSQAKVDAVTVADGQKDVTVDITYTANDQTTHVVYVDGDGHTVKTDTVTGKTDQTVTTNSTVPTGWELTKGQVVPETITFTGDSTPETKVTVQHHHSKVSHTNPVPGDGKTPTNKPINGAHDSDLNQTITRTIKVHEPGKDANTITQTAKIFRDATVDDVTGEVTYTAWSTDATDWAEYDAPVHAGYTVSQAKVDAVTVADGQKDVTVDITYTANEGTVLIKYVDRDGNEIGRQVITGHVGDTIKVTPQFPENWVPVDPDTVPAEVQIKEENGQIIIVVVRHAEKDPVQTKKVTRTITVTTPDGQTKTIRQVVTISRYGDLDLVTGQIAWQPWTTAQWDVFKPAAIAGYTPSLAEVPAVTVDGETTDQTVDITYAAVTTPAQPEHQAPTASDTTDAQQATNQKADSNAQPAVTVVTSQQTATAQQAESTTNSRRLPQTGNSHDASALAGLGLASLMGLLGLGGKRRKRD